MYRKHPAEKLEILAIKLALIIAFILTFSLHHGITLVYVSAYAALVPVPDASYYRDLFWFFLYIGIGIVAISVLPPDWFNPNKKD